MMNLQGVKTGRILHDISIERYVRIPYAKTIVRFLFSIAPVAVFVLKEADLSTGAVPAPHRRACSEGVEA